MNDIPNQTTGQAVAVAAQGPGKRSVLNAAADRFNMEPAAFEATLRGTVFPPAGTREEFAAFLVVANEYGLNPITREIYAYPKKGGGIQPIVSIDGWARIINEHPKFDGMSFEFEEIPGDPAKPPGTLGAADLACTCTMWRKDRTRPVVVTEYLSECYRGTDPWKMKRRMLRHKTLIQTARYAFGFASIMDEDEAAAVVDTLTPVAEAPQKPARGRKTLGGGFAPKDGETRPEAASEAQGAPIDAEFEEVVDQKTGEVTQQSRPQHTGEPSHPSPDSSAGASQVRGSAPTNTTVASTATTSGENLSVTASTDGGQRPQQQDRPSNAPAGQAGTQSGASGGAQQEAASSSPGDGSAAPAGPDRSAPLGSPQNPAVTPAEALEAGTYFHVQSDPINATGQRPFYDEDGFRRGWALESQGLRVATDITGAVTTTWWPQAQQQAAADDAPWDNTPAGDEGGTRAATPWEIFDAMLMTSSDWPAIRAAMGQLAKDPVWNSEPAEKEACRVKTFAKAKALGIDPAKDATAFQCFLAASNSSGDIQAIFADAIREAWYTSMAPEGQASVTRAVMARTKALG